MPTKLLSRWVNTFMDALGPRRFAPSVEHIYEVRRNDLAVPAARIGLLAAPIVFLCFGVWDYWSDPSAVATTLPLRVLFCCLWLSLWAGTFWAPVRQQLSLVLSTAAIIAFIGITCVLNLLPNGLLYGFAAYSYPVIALIIKPNARFALFNGVLLLLVFNTSTLLYDTPHPLVFNINFMLFFLCVVTYIAVYCNELRDRQVFKLEMELERQATTDGLSGAMNRRHFLKNAQIELDRAHRFLHPTALLMIDIDHFKTINDTYGHHIGDETIRSLVEICRKNLRSTDLLGRIGGEEFAILLPETGHNDAQHVAEVLRTLLSHAQNLDRHSKDENHAFTVSIGVASFQTNDSIDTLMRRADNALYEAKRQGRNRVVVGEEDEF